MTLDLEETIILVQQGTRYKVRYWNAVMGEQPVGPRLARGDTFPTLATSAKTKMEGEELCQRWKMWLMARPKRKMPRRKVYS